MTTHESLRALVQRFARAVDQRALGELAALFHPDAEIVGSRGTQSLEEWLEAMAAPRSFPVSMHMMGDPLIEWDDGATEATLDTYAVVYQLSDRGSGGGDLTLGVRYRDEVAELDGCWRIRRRTSQTLWVR